MYGILMLTLTGGILMGSILPYIAAPWILCEIEKCFFIGGAVLIQLQVVVSQHIPTYELYCHGYNMD